MLSIDDNLVQLRDAAKMLPQNVTHRTLWRWAKRGVGLNDARKLEAIRIGRYWYTTREALERFIQNGTD